MAKKTSTFYLVVRVKCPSGVSREEAESLLGQVILSGEEDASRTVMVGDIDNPDAVLVNRSSFHVV